MAFPMVEFWLCLVGYGYTVWALVEVVCGRFWFAGL